MSCRVVIGKNREVMFAPNIGVLLDSSALRLSPKMLARYVRIAFEHCQDPPLVDACCGGCGPLDGAGALRLDLYLNKLAEIERSQISASPIARRVFVQWSRRLARLSGISQGRRPECRK